MTVDAARPDQKKQGKICEACAIRPWHGLYGKYNHPYEVREGHFEGPSQIVRKIQASGRLKALPEGAEEEETHRSDER